MPCSNIYMSHICRLLAALPKIWVSIYTIIFIGLEIRLIKIMISIETQTFGRAARLMQQCRRIVKVERLSKAKSTTHDFEQAIMKKLLKQKINYRRFCLTSLVIAKLCGQLAVICDRLYCC